MDIQELQKNWMKCVFEKIIIESMKFILLVVIQFVKPKKALGGFIIMSITQLTN